MQISFIIPTNPVAQPRERATQIPAKGTYCKVCKRSKMIPSTHPVDSIKLTKEQQLATGKKRKPHPIVEFKQLAKAAAQKAYDGELLEGPLHCEIVLVFQRPAAMKSGPREWRPQKPDRDNCEKSVLDCLEGIIFKNDSQCCDGAVKKFYAASDEQPHVEVTIWPLEDVPASNVQLSLPLEAKPF